MSDDRTVGDLLEGGDVVSLVTDDLRARPMTVQAVEGSTVHFLTSRDADWVEQLGDGDRAALTLADGDVNVWASLVGTVTTTDDQDELERLWSLFANAYFDGPDDPELLAVSLATSEGEWWDSPGNVVARAVRMGAALVSDDEAGDQGDVATS
jgi:general stress protein 26